MASFDGVLRPSSDFGESGLVERRIVAAGVKEYKVGIGLEDALIGEVLVEGDAWRDLFEGD
jgi:hypothetical protein